jgi:hypothetical protein
MGTVGYGNGDMYAGAVAPYFQTSTLKLSATTNSLGILLSGIYPGVPIFNTDSETYLYYAFPTNGFVTFIYFGIDSSLFAMFSGQVYPTGGLNVVGNQIWPPG